MAAAARNVTPAIIAAAEDFVRGELAAMDASHDYAHIMRVRANARNLARLEGLSEEESALIDLSALLHDVKDWKYSGSDDQTAKAVKEFLTGQGLDSHSIGAVVDIISKVGFKEELQAASAAPGTGLGAANGAAAPQAGAGDDVAGGAAAGGAAGAAAGGLSLPAAIVQDADRLDAIGAIGIARCFTFGGAKHRVLYDPAVPPREGLSKEAYMKGGAQSTTINHFHEKLLKLKGLMKTAAGARIAEQRHDFMLQYLEQFEDEWYGRA